MSALSEALGNDAAPHTLEHQGKVYHFRLVDQDAKVAFERWLFARAIAAAGQLRSILPAEDYAGHLKTLNTDYLRGEYAFESRLGQEVLRTVPGCLALCRILLDATDQEVMCLATQKGPELQALFQVVLAESFPGVRFEKGTPGEGEDPNAQRPAR